MRPGYFSIRSSIDSSMPSMERMHELPLIVSYARTRPVIAPSARRRIACHVIVDCCSIYGARYLWVSKNDGGAVAPSHRVRYLTG